MEKPIALVLLALVLLAASTGCAKSPGADTRGESTDLSEDMSDLESLDEELGLSELDSLEDELAELDSLFS